MRTKLCETFGIEYPIFAFTRSAAVAAAVSKAGGMGVLGAVEKPPEELKSALAWMDEHVDGKPYGVDVVMPVSYAGTEKIDLEKMIPEGHVAWINDLLARNGVPDLPPDERHAEGLLQWLPDRARKQIEISLEHPVKLIASALGPPPPDVIEECHQHGLQVAALCGNKHHAEAHVEAGVDVVIAQGTEAGGHTGDVSTMVLVPEIVDAVAPRPVLAAGGIGRGRQIAAALALGAEGVWTGSIWLTVEEADTHPVVVQKLMDATSRDTVRSRSMTGKPARQLRTPYTEAWDADDSPGALPLPLQFMLTADATQRLHRFAGENEGAARLVGSPVGQIVGSMSSIRSTQDVMASLVREYEESAQRMTKFDIPITN